MDPDPLPAAAVEVDLHEERVDVAVERVASRVLVRRRIVTEVRQVEVEVRREVLEVEEVSWDDASGVSPPPAGSPRAPQVLVLSEEVPVVSLRVQPYERVVLEVQTLTEHREVSTAVGAERAEVTTDEL